MSYSSVGSILSELEQPARVCTIIQARVLIFDIEFPITQGYPVSVSSNTLVHSDMMITVDCAIMITG